jgi:hypothetical protein
MVLHLAMVISCLACSAVGPKMFLLKRLILCQWLQVAAFSSARLSLFLIADFRLTSGLPTP